MTIGLSGLWDLPARLIRIGTPPVWLHTEGQRRRNAVIMNRPRIDRITLIISSLTTGGAERVMTTMANAWVARGRTVSMVTLTGPDMAPFYPLDPAINLIPLGQAAPSRTPIDAARANTHRLIALRDAITRTDPDIVISFLDTTNIRTLLATVGLSVPVIVAEHTDPGLKQMPRVWSGLRRATYPRARQVVVLSHSAREYFPSRIQSHTTVLPNPVAIDPTAPRTTPAARQSIAAMGRFGPEKGFDLLLDAFARIAETQPAWDLVIWGDGALRADLETRRDHLGLHNRVALPGRTTEPHHALRQSEIFALSSRREGFPMVLAEALACGLPAVAFNISSGISDILRPGLDGLLVEPGDVPGFAAALDRLITDPAERARMSTNGPHVLERFGVETVMDRWDALIADVVAA